MEKKAQRLARKVTLIAIFLLSNGLFSQDNISKRELTVYNKIIGDFHKNTQLKATIDENPTMWIDTKLKDYYEFRYEGKIKYKNIIAQKGDKVDYDTPENNEQTTKEIFSSYSRLDLYFNQSDINKSLKQNKIGKWKNNDLKNVDILTEEQSIDLQYENFSVVKLSPPLFSSDKKFMGVHFITKTFKLLYIYRLENGIWVEIGKLQ